MTVEWVPVDLVADPAVPVAVSVVNADGKIALLIELRREKQIGCNMFTSYLLLTRIGHQVYVDLALKVTYG